MAINLTAITSLDIVGLRNEFRDLSGLPDMANSDVDKWINRGIRMLDLATEFAYSYARETVVVPINTWLVKFLSECRVVTDIFAIDATEGRTRITLIDAKSFRETYPNLSDNDGSVPKHCILATTRAATADSIVGADTTYDKWVESEQSGVDYVGMLIGPKTDKEYQIEVFGKFYSPAISDTNVSNWWTINFSDVVIAAALYKLNTIMYRNREGAADYMTDIKSMLTMLDYDSAEKESSQIVRMEG
jgi:hypothetical protein